MKRVAIRITGKVQGVFYRQSTREKAEELGLTGFVRNEPDGSVYAEAQGPEEQLERLISWCRRGPSRAVVTGVQVSDIPAGNESRFSVER